MYYSRAPLFIYFSWTSLIFVIYFQISKILKNRLVCLYGWFGLRRLITISFLHFSQTMKFLSNRVVRPFSGYNHLMSLLICRRFAKIQPIMGGVKVELRSAHGISTRKPCGIASQLDLRPFYAGFSRNRWYSSFFLSLSHLWSIPLLGCICADLRSQDNFTGL